MPDLNRILTALHRPRPLVGAARKALGLYRRSRDLQPLLARAPAGHSVPDRLLAAEASLEASRKNGRAGYSVADHIALLAALMAESRLNRPQEV